MKRGFNNNRINLDLIIGTAGGISCYIITTLTDYITKTITNSFCQIIAKICVVLIITVIFFIMSSLPRERRKK